jgi:hypothetical protein
MPGEPDAVIFYRGLNHSIGTNRSGTSLVDLGESQVPFSGHSGWPFGFCRPVLDNTVCPPKCGPTYCPLFGGNSRWNRFAGPSWRWPPRGMGKSWAVHALAGGKTIHEPHSAGRYRHQPASQSQTNQEHNYRRFSQHFIDDVTRVRNVDVGEQQK